jgi:hypothetical protein
MSTAIEAVDAALHEVTTARGLISKLRSNQVRGVDQLAGLKSLAYAWFNSHRITIDAKPSGVDLTAIDDAFQTILNSTTRSAARTTYLGALTRAKNALIELRASLLTVRPPSNIQNSDDIVPDFSPLVGSAEMRDVLTRRWVECCKCVSVEAHLAAIVMMGGLLEALFVARANKMDNKAPLVKATSAPKDKKSGKTLDYQEWMLDSYIKVARELAWITDSARQVADVLKEFRNYVHPAKELRHGVALAHNDSVMFWNVTKSLVRQLLASVDESK